MVYVKIRMLCSNEGMFQHIVELCGIILARSIVTDLLVCMKSKVCFLYSIFYREIKHDECY